MKDRRVGAVVGSSHSRVPQLDRLRQRFVLQRARDSAAPYLPARCGEPCPGQAANRWKLQEGETDEGLSFACDPETILANGGVIERGLHPLVERLPRNRHRGWGVLLGGGHHLVQFRQTLRILVVADGHERHASRLHQPALMLRRRDQLVVMSDEVELVEVLQADLSIADPAQGLELERAVSAHPGVASTNLGSHLSGFRGTMAQIGIRVIAQDPEHGAFPTLYAATQDIPGNTYIGPDGLGQMRGAPVVTAPSKSSQDPDLAKRLWARSAELTGVGSPTLTRA